MSFFVEDESRFGLMPITRRRITAKGVKPIQGVQQVFESYYIYGAVEPLTGESFFLEMPRLDSDCFQVFLNEFCSGCSDRFIIMLLDNGSIHKAKKLVSYRRQCRVFIFTSLQSGVKPDREVMAGHKGQDWILVV